MADRYWVGGTDLWDNVAGTKWATTSGGTGGASAPTSVDDVYFDASSGAGTVTPTSNATGKNINFTGFTGTLAGSVNFDIYGSLTVSAVMTYTHTGTIRWRASGTITSAGKTIGGVQSDSSSVTIQLADALNIATRIIALNIGTFTTNNFAVTAGSLQATGASGSPGSNPAINLGSSTVTLSSTTPLTLTNPNLVFNAGTSTINLTNTSPTITASAGLAFYDMVVTSQTTATFTTSNIYNNLTINARTTTGVGIVEFDADQTINGTLTIGAGAFTYARRIIRSDVRYTPRTLTCNAVAALTDVDFSDIVFAGNCISGGNITGTRLGDGKGNTNITFDTPKTVYFRATTSANWGNTGSWSLTSGGAATDTAFPLAQDTAIFPAATYPASASVVSFNAAYLVGSLSMGLRTTNTISFSTGAVIVIYGDWTNGSGTTITGTTNAINFVGRNTQTFTTGAKTFGTRAITVDSLGGTLNLANTLTCGTLTVTRGTFTTNNNALTINALNSNNTANARTINFGSSAVSISGTTPVDFGDGTNLTLGSTTSTITCSSTSALTFSGGSKTFGTVSFTSTSNNTRTIAGNNTFTTLSSTAPAASSITNIILTGNQTVTGTFTCAGGSAIRRQFVQANVIGTTRTITAGTLAGNDCDFRDITIAGGAAGTAPTRAGNCGGNTGITFPAAKSVFRVGTNTTWAGSASWATTSGGTGNDNNFPLAQDTATINNSTTGTSVDANFAFNIGSLVCSARTTAYTLTISGATTHYGNFTLGSGITVSGLGVLTFAGRGTMSINTAGKTITNAMRIAAPGGTFQLAAALVNTATSNGAFTLSQGTLDMNNFTLTVAIFTAAGDNLAKTIAFGTASMVLTDSDWSTLNATNLTTTGARNVSITYVANNTINIDTRNSLDEANAISFTFPSNITSGNADLEGVYRNLDFSLYGRNINPATITVYGDVVLNSIATNSLSYIFAATSGTQTITTNGNTNPIGSSGITKQGAGTLQLLDALNMTTRPFTLTEGTADLNGFSLSCGAFTSTNTNVRAITNTSGGITLTLSGTVWDTANATNFTIPAVNITTTNTSTSSKAFSGGGLSYGTLTIGGNNGGSYQFDITGSNTFTSITKSTQGLITIRIGAGNTQTVGTFDITGTVSRPTTIRSTTTGVQGTISQASGTVSVSYCTIQDSNATGGATFEALTSNFNVDAGNNTGWIFGGSTFGMLMLF